jgi:hypothetical protein
MADLTVVDSIGCAGAACGGAGIGAGAACSGAGIGAGAACGGAGIGAGAACGVAGIGAGSADAASGSVGVPTSSISAASGSVGATSSSAASGSVGATPSSASAAIGSINAPPSSAGASSATSGSAVGAITPKNFGCEFAHEILDLFSRKQTKDNEKHKQKVFRIISRDIRLQLTKKNLPLFAQNITDLFKDSPIDTDQLHVFIIVNLSPLVKRKFTFPSLLKNKWKQLKPSKQTKKENLLHDLKALNLVFGFQSLVLLIYLKSDFYNI